MFDSTVISIANKEPELKNVLTKTDDSNKMDGFEVINITSLMSEDLKESKVTAENSGEIIITTNKEMNINEKFIENITSIEHSVTRGTITYDDKVATIKPVTYVTASTRPDREKFFDTQDANQNNSNDSNKGITLVQTTFYEKTIDELTSNEVSGTTNENDNTFSRTMTYDNIIKTKNIYDNTVSEITKFNIYDNVVEANSAYGNTTNTPITNFEATMHDKVKEITSLYENAVETTTKFDSVVDTTKYDTDAEKVNDVERVPEYSYELEKTASGNEINTTMYEATTTYDTTARIAKDKNDFKTTAAYSNELETTIYDIANIHDGASGSTTDDTLILNSEKVADQLNANDTVPGGNNVMSSNTVEKQLNYYKSPDDKVYYFQPDASSPPLQGYKNIINAGRSSSEQNSEEKNICRYCETSGEQYSYIIVACIPTKMNNFDNRQTARQTWLNATIYSGDKTSLRLTHVFVMGKSAVESQLQKQIEEESAIYGDIVQTDFIDSYANLSIKSFALLKWALNFCPCAMYILKIDDDVFVNTFQLFRLVDSIHFNRLVLSSAILNNLLLNQSTIDLSINTSIYCHVKRHSPVLRITRNAVPMSVYKEEFYPPFCSGYAYLMKRDALEAIYSKALKSSYFINEDVLITGFLAGQAGLRHTFLNSIYWKNSALLRGTKTDRMRTMINCSFNFVYFHRLKYFYWKPLWSHIVNSIEDEL